MIRDLSVEERLDRIEAALRKLVLATNNIQTHKSDKLNKLPETGGADHIWMNTTYCFDIARRLEYFFQALYPLLDQDDEPISIQTLARNIHDDYEMVHPTVDKDPIEPGDWENAARNAEEVLIERYAENEERYQEAIEQAMGSQPGERA